MLDYDLFDHAERQQFLLPESGSIQDRFEAFDSANPHVYDLFRRFADEALRAGRTRYSADAILHRIRWHLDIEVNQGAEPFKINDHFSSRYARKLMADEARFAGFFELRGLRAT